MEIMMCIWNISGYSWGRDVPGQVTVYRQSPLAVIRYAGSSCFTCHVLRNVHHDCGQLCRGSTCFKYIILANCVILGCHLLEHSRLCSSLKTLCHLSPIPLSRIIHVYALYRMMGFNHVSCVLAFSPLPCLEQHIKYTKLTSKSRVSCPTYPTLPQLPAWISCGNSTVFLIVANYPQIEAWNSFQDNRQTMYLRKYYLAGKKNILCSWDVNFNLT